MTTVEFVQGDMVRALEVVLVDRNGGAVPIDGWTVRFESNSFPGVVIDVAGTVLDGGNGLCSFDAFGNNVTADQMGTRRAIACTGRVKATNPSAKPAFSGELRVNFVRQPL